MASADLASPAPSAGWLQKKKSRVQLHGPNSQDALSYLGHVSPRGTQCPYLQRESVKPGGDFKGPLKLQIPLIW